MTKRESKEDEEEKRIFSAHCCLSSHESCKLFRDEFGFFFFIGLCYLNHAEENQVHKPNQQPNERKEENKKSKD